MKYLYIFLTVILSVYGQLVLKWRLDEKGDLPDVFKGKVNYFIEIFFDFWVISSFLSAFLASFTWMLALTEFDLSFAYPFMSLSFLLVFFLSAYFFNEEINSNKIIGLCLVVFGLIIFVKK
jgi:multidrug transporter EmrE-like cation transporter